MSNTQQEIIENINEVYGDKPASKKTLKEKGGKYSKENRKQAKELKKLEKAGKVPKLRRQNAVSNITLPKQTKSDDEEDFDVSEKTEVDEGTPKPSKSPQAPKSPEAAKLPQAPKSPQAAKKSKSPKEVAVDEAPEKWDDEVREKPKSAKPTKTPKDATQLIPLQIPTAEMSQISLLSPNSEGDEEVVKKETEEANVSKDVKTARDANTARDAKTARDARASRALQRITSESMDKKTRPKTQFQESGNSRVQSKEYSENKGLLCTKACHFCKKNESGEWGVCSREKCTFAHSLSELQLSQCSFGENCKRKNGSNSCQFKHPDESNDKYYSRTGIEKPDLPETSELTRRPKSREEFGAVTKNKNTPKESYKSREPMSSRERGPKDSLKKEQVTREVPVREVPVREAVVREAVVREVPVRQTPKLAEAIVIHVPSCMKRDALEMCLAKGLTNFQIVLTD